jgi:hypothetical protein
MTGGELALMIWRAAVAADQGDPIEAAKLLEHAAQRLRQEGGEEEPARSGTAGKQPGEVLLHLARPHL